jgi:hypothetical protein
MTPRRRRRQEARGSALTAEGPSLKR